MTATPLTFEDRLARWQERARERAALEPVVAARLAHIERPACPVHGTVLEMDLPRAVHDWRDMSIDPTPAWLPCPECEHEKTEIMPRFRAARRAGVPLSYFGACLDDLEMEAVTRETLARYAASPDGALVLLGPPGSGKSHAALAILQAQRRLGLYVTLSELIHLHRLTYKDRSAKDVREIAMRTSLLVLDEVGRAVGGNDALALVHDVCDRRYAEGLPVIVCTNCSRSDLRAELGPAIADRLSGTAFAVVEFSGSSHRGRDRDARAGRLALARRLEAVARETAATEGNF